MTTLHLYNTYKKLNCTHQELHENELSKSNAFNDYFTSIFTQEGLSPFPKLNDSAFPKIPHISISVERIANLTKQLYPAYFLKKLSHEIAPILTLIFQSSLYQDVLPAEWNFANVIPIFKG